MTKLYAFSIDKKKVKHCISLHNLYMGEADYITVTILFKSEKKEGKQGTNETA